MKLAVRICLSLLWLAGASWWWHQDEIEQIKFDNQVAARACWKHYDEAKPGPDFHSVAEGKVERCYDALAADLNGRLQRVTWWPAAAAGVVPPLIAWSVGWCVLRRRGAA